MAQAPVSQSHNGKSPKALVTRCNTHNDEEVILFCETCDELMCTECLTSDHKSHSITTVK